MKMRNGYHRVELNRTSWDVPQRYVNLSPVGSGAYGQVGFKIYYLDGIIHTYIVC